MRVVCGVRVHSPRSFWCSSVVPSSFRSHREILTACSCRSATLKKNVCAQTWWLKKDVKKCEAERSDGLVTISRRPTAQERVLQHTERKTGHSCNKRKRTKPKERKGKRTKAREGITCGEEGVAEVCCCCHRCSVAGMSAEKKGCLGLPSFLLGMLIVSSTMRREAEKAEQSRTRDGDDEKRQRWCSKHKIKINKKKSTFTRLQKLGQS